MFVNELNLIFASSITLIALGLFYLYYRNRDNKEFMSAGLFFIGCALSLYAEYHLGFNAGKYRAIFWSKIEYIGILSFIYTFPVFFMVILGLRMRKTAKAILAALAITGFAFTGLTDLIITNETFMYGNILQPKIGALYPVFLILLLIILGLYYINGILIKKSRSKIARVRPVLISSAIALALGTVDVIGELLHKPLVSVSVTPFGLFIVALCFAWVFLRQYSWAFDNLARTSMELERVTAKSNRDFMEFIQLIAETLEAKDHYTAGHSLRVMDYAVRIAKALDLSTGQIESLKQACLLHDIGKISIPDSILNKKQPLTKEERKYIMQHPEIGKKILSAVSEFRGILVIINAHHERIDGNGYPQGLKNKEIPLLARVIAVADTYDAMRSERPYRSAKTKKQAIKELKTVKGTQLDAEIVEKFIEIIS
jgi:HD-GYP domain-containing protein (c-di-GMP phosphodiesterase class II)